MPGMLAVCAVVAGLRVTGLERRMALRPVDVGSGSGVHAGEGRVDDGGALLDHVVPSDGESHVGRASEVVRCDVVGSGAAAAVHQHRKGSGGRKQEADGGRQGHALLVGHRGVEREL